MQRGWADKVQGYKGGWGVIKRKSFLVIQLTLYSLSYSIYILFLYFLYLRSVNGPPCFCRQAWRFSTLGPFGGLAHRLFHAQAWCSSHRRVLPLTTLFSETFVFMRRRGGWASATHLSALVASWGFLAGLLLGSLGLPGDPWSPLVLPGAFLVR